VILKRRYRGPFDGHTREQLGHHHIARPNCRRNAHGDHRGQIDESVSALVQWNKRAPPAHCPCRFHGVASFHSPFFVATELQLEGQKNQPLSIVSNCVIQDGMPRRLVFRHTVEGLFQKAYGPQLSISLKKTLKELGLESPAVDAEAFGKAFGLLRDAAHPGIETSRAEREMGARFLKGYFETTMGNLTKMMLKLLSVESALSRVPQSLMSGANFVEAKVLRVAEKNYLLSMNDYCTSPDFLCGVVSEMIQLVGGKPEVDVVQHEGRTVVLRVRWV
jgi:uncharacterized protein (TIGR02265 family)